MNGFRLILIFIGIAWLLSGIGGTWNNYKIYEKQQKNLIDEKERIERESVNLTASLKKKLKNRRMAGKKEADRIRKKIANLEDDLDKETKPILEKLAKIRARREKSVKINDTMAIELLGTRIKNLERNLAAKEERPKRLLENNKTTLEEALLESRSSIAKIEKKIELARVDNYQRINAKTKSAEFKFLSIIAALIGLILFLFGTFIGGRQPVIVE